MTEENKDMKTEAPVDMNPSTIEAKAQAAHTAEIAEEGALGADTAAYLEKEYQAQDLLSSDQKTAASAKEAAIDEMEKASQKALEAMRAQGGEKADKIVDEAEVKLDDAFENFRTYLQENVSPEKVKDELENFSKEVSKVLKASRDSIDKTVNSEQFQSTVSAGRDFVKGTGNMIGEGLKYGYDKAMEVPEIKAAAAKVDEGVDKIRQSEFLKDVVGGAEKSLNDFSNFIFSSLNSFFDNKEAAPEEKAASAETEEDSKKAE